MSDTSDTSDALRNSVLPLGAIGGRHGGRIDEMEDQGLPILVCRYGREVAVLTPVEGRRRVPREAFEPIELSSFQAGLLRNIAAISPRTLADPGSGCAYERPSDVMVALARMELAGLVEKGVGGWRATGAGVRQVAALDRITPL